MSSRNGAGKSLFAGSGCRPIGKGKSTEHSALDQVGPKSSQQSHETSDIGIVSMQEDEWDSAGSESENPHGTTSAVPSSTTASENCNSEVKRQGWGNHDIVGNNSSQVANSRRPDGAGNYVRLPDSGLESYCIEDYCASPSLQHGSQQSERGDSLGSESRIEGQSISSPNRGGLDPAIYSESGTKPSQGSGVSDEVDYVIVSQDDISKDYDYHVSQESLETREESNQKLILLESKAAKGKQCYDTAEPSHGVTSQKLCRTTEEKTTLPCGMKTLHGESKEEMDHQEQFFKEQRDKVHKATQDKEQNFEKKSQEERTKATLTDVDSGIRADRRRRNEKTDKFTKRGSKSLGQRRGR